MRYRLEPKIPDNFFVVDRPQPEDRPTIIVQMVALESFSKRQMDNACLVKQPVAVSGMPRPTLCFELAHSVLRRALSVHTKVFHVLFDHLVESMLRYEHGHGSWLSSGLGELWRVSTSVRREGQEGVHCRNRTAEPRAGS